MVCEVGCGYYHKDLFIGRVVCCENGDDRIVDSGNLKDLFIGRVVCCENGKDRNVDLVILLLSDSRFDIPQMLLPTSTYIWLLSDYNYTISAIH